MEEVRSNTEVEVDVRSGDLTSCICRSSANETSSRRRTKHGNIMFVLIISPSGEYHPSINIISETLASRVEVLMMSFSSGLRTQLLARYSKSPSSSRSLSRLSSSWLFVPRASRNGFQQSRSASILSRLRAGLREEAQKTSTAGLILQSAALLTLGSALAYILYRQYEKSQPQYEAYPPAVEKPLRLALHFTHIKPDADQAISYFHQAIAIATGLGMDPFSDEFLGLRLRLAQSLEEFGRVKQAAEVMDSIVNDCTEKLEQLDRPSVVNERKADDRVTPVLRQRLIKKIVESRAHLASLYESDYIQDPSRAKQTLSQALDLVVKEMKDLSTQGISEDNGAGLSYAEIAAILSQMGHLFTVTGEFANAVQVYSLALDPCRKAYNGKSSCQEAMILNNIAGAMGQGLAQPNAKINGQPANPQSIKMARKAIITRLKQVAVVVADVPDTERDERCTGCLLSSRFSLANQLDAEGDKVAAKEMYASVLPELKASPGTLALVAEAEAALAR